MLLDFLGGVWSVFVWMFCLAIFVGYLFALFAVITDIFRDHEMKGVIKAVWCFFLIFIPVLTVLAYLIINGEGMNKRRAAAVRQSQVAADNYIREVANTPMDTAVDLPQQTQQTAQKATQQTQSMK